MKKPTKTAAAFGAMLLAYLIAENKLIIRKKQCILRNDGLKIMHISDCHGRNKEYYNRRICRWAREEKPDLIFITGDLISRDTTDFSPSEKLLTELCGCAPVYMCMGNHEQSLPDDMSVKFFAMMSKTDVKLLKNEGEYLDIMGRKIFVAGIEPQYTVYKKNDGYRDLDSYTAAEMTAAIGKKPDCETFILAHTPLFAEEYRKWGADHVFSGHTHGGVVRLFGVPMLSPERRLFPKYSALDIYDIDGMDLCVSAGIGKLRVFNDPIVTFYIM